MKVLLLLLFTSCVTTRQLPTRPQEVRQIKVESCVHKFIDKGVKFIEASTECADRIFEKVEI